MQTSLVLLFFYLLKENISSPIRYSFISVFPDDNADIFAASLLILYWNFSSLILSSIIVMVSFYILSKRFFLKHEGLSDARVGSITQKEDGFTVHFL